MDDQRERLGAEAADQDEDASAPLDAVVARLDELLRLVMRPASIQRDYLWGAGEARMLLGGLMRCFAAHRAATKPPPPPLNSDAAAALSHAEAVALGEAAPLGLIAAHPPAGSFGRPTSYYLGEFVLSADRPGEPGATALIYDGLQRITTLTILIAILRDALAQQGGGAVEAAALDALLRAPSGAPRLSLADGERALAEEIQPPGEALKRRRRLSTRSARAQRIHETAEAIRTELQDWPWSKLAAFAGFLRRRVHALVVRFDDPALARQVFVTKNMLGVSLTPVDIFKGEFAGVAAAASVEREALAMWDRLAERFGPGGLAALLKAVDLIERRQPQDLDHLTQLAEALRVGALAGGVAGFIARLAAWAEAWAELERRLDDPSADDFSGDVWRLGLLPNPEWRPLALLWIAQFQALEARPDGVDLRARGAFERRMRALHRHVAAIELARHGDNDREKIFLNAVRQAAVSEDPLRRRDGPKRRARNPLNEALRLRERAIERVEESLRQPWTEPKQRHCLLRWIESTLWDDAPPAHIAFGSVEHIMPQRPEPGSDWRAEASDDGLRYLLCHQLGNLCLLDRAVNKAVGNDEFAAKSALYRDQAPRYRLLGDVVTASAWGEAEIAARTERLAAHVWRVLDREALGPAAPRADDGRAGANREDVSPA